MGQYPEPAVRYQGYSDLHFATEQQMRSWFALANCDRGELSLCAGRLTFKGMRVLVECPHVTTVRLVRKSFPWGVAAGVGAVVAVLGYLKSPALFTWGQPLPYIVLTIFLAVCVKQLRERWVEVAYREAGETRRAYFRREPVFWGSGAARTQQLLKDIEDLVLQAHGGEPGGNQSSQPPAAGAVRE